MYYDYNDKELGLKNPKKMGYREQELNQNRDNATHSHIYIYINFKTISPKTLRKKVIRKHIQ